MLRAQDAPAAQQPAAGQKATKNYKDRAEYDLYAKVTQTTDPKARLAVLKEWETKYPQTDFKTERNQYFLATLAKLAPNDPAMKKELVSKADEVLKDDPKNFQAAYLASVYGPQIGGDNPPPDLLTQVDSAAHTVLNEAPNTFDQSKKAGEHDGGPVQRGEKTEHGHSA